VSISGRRDAKVGLTLVVCEVSAVKRERKLHQSTDIIFAKQHTVDSLAVPAPCFQLGGLLLLTHGRLSRFDAIKTMK